MGHVLMAREVMPDDSTDAGWLERMAGLGEKVLESVTYENKRHVFVIYPAGGYSRRSGLEVGVMPVFGWYPLKSKTLNTISFSPQISTNGMVELRSEVELYLDKWRWFVKTEYLKMPEKYWGIYSAPAVFDGVTYDSRNIKGETELFRKIGHHWLMGISAMAGSWRFSAWQYGPDEWPVFLQEGRLVGFGPVLLFDSRDHPLFPHCGIYFKSSWLYFAGDDFSDFLTDLRYYVSLNRNVLALQGLMEWTPGNSIPYYMLPELGGKYRLRGIDNPKRVVDKSVWLLRGELRMPLWWRLSAVMFAEAGGAGSRFLSDVGTPVLSAGGGLRFRMLPHEPLNIRMDVAVASGGLYGMTISLKEAF
ncbi:hypothetical protein ACT3CD_07070 [Geofilum sp. OHC36d9]|uniref:hypothetical protein n=1 Tax=Geofilum sp. OHC36d9 TaxID=3458413 RepID=UPI004034CBB2